MSDEQGASDPQSVVDLRADATYGGFIAHKPAKAKVTINRVKGKNASIPRASRFTSTTL